MVYLSRTSRALGWSPGDELAVEGFDGVVTATGGTTFVPDRSSGFTWHVDLGDSVARLQDQSAHKDGKD